ncbi:hypothetical protein [Burkholderia vietnamiensis]|uniref:hypothetical protein n=1 Tax=Burkholderia vietnamiensis TaxID=60552 RepID=UPI0015892340|nr:hypothetical protein [Burkholderia vietnamiensis]MCA8013296.1 hypothetical protein [Burkholderia vietnamiensis]MCA8266404.1 hypothetical protein [Burkholderia vietnamiensis]HDR9003066.1 hypothetical protein [Burkholderia vietnamiensis]HDR9006890.1 hypothetical protein [Burkholderia vietnamiensis]
MEQNVTSLIALALPATGGVLWWLLRGAHTKAEATAQELANFKLHVAENYVTSNTLQKALDGLTDTIKAVFAKLERIEDKLDGKADKQ